MPPVKLPADLTHHSCLMCRWNPNIATLPSTLGSLAPADWEVSTFYSLNGVLCGPVEDYRFSSLHSGNQYCSYFDGNITIETCTSSIHHATSENPIQYIPQRRPTIQVQPRLEENSETIGYVPILNCRQPAHDSR